MSTYPVKQVILLRTKYPDGKGGTKGIRLGKAAAQVAHASMKVFFDRKTEGTTAVFTRHAPTSASSSDVFIEYPPNTLTIPLTDAMAEWVDGKFAKIVLGCESEEDLREAHRLAVKAGIPAALIEDAGMTEFAGVPTLTTCAIGPARVEDIDLITGPAGPFGNRLRLL